MIKNNLTRRKKEDLILFNKAVEYFEKYNENSFRIENNSRNSRENQLKDEMLTELDNLKEIIASNPDRKFNALSEAQKQDFYDFVEFYSLCPLCGTFNHYYHLKKFYFDESKSIIKNHLLKMMEMNNHIIENYDLKIGIPCCNCYKRNFENIEH